MRNLVIQVPGVGGAALWVAASVTDRVVTLRDQPDARMKPMARAPAVGQALNSRDRVKFWGHSFAKRLLCAMMVLAAGCAPMTAGPRGWVTHDGSAFADPADHADCLLKARDVEVSAPVDGELPIYGLLLTDLTLFSVCMDAHGYRLRRAHQANPRS